MSFTPTPIQTLILWRLLASGGGEYRKRIKPALEAKDRKALEAAGLVQVENRKEPNAGKGAHAILYVSLSEQGWAWAAMNLDAEVSTRLTAAGPILRDILRRLKVHLDRKGIALADFICCPPAREPETRGDLSQQIRDAYCRTSGGRWNVRVRLADLRGALPGVPREEFDGALLALETAGALVLYPLDDPQEIRPGDEAAALPNSLGIRRHILYIER